MTFTGTTEQVYWKQLIHEVFLSNELGPYSAYELSWAGTSSSGYTFGYAQWDLAANSSSRDILRDILQNAVDASGAYIVQDSDPTTDRTNDKIIGVLMTEVIQPGGTALTEGQKNLINQALSSAYGQSTIDQEHDSYLGDLLLEVDNAILSVGDAVDREFLGAELPKLFLCDFRNQYSPTTFGRLINHINGVDTNAGLSVTKKVGLLGVDDLLNFYFSTNYAGYPPPHGMQDLMRRFTNVVSVAGGYFLPLDAAARDEEAKGMIRVYQDFVKGNDSLSSYNGFVAAVIDPAREALIGEYVTQPGITAPIDGEVVVGEDAASIDRSSNKTTDNDNGNEGGALTGTTLSDLMFGESGNDQLHGQGGDDVLYGGTGNDLLRGGLGTDYYVFNAGDGVDTIEDSDGLGQLIYDGVILNGGEYVAGDGGGIYRQQTAGATFYYYYDLLGATLTIERDDGVAVTPNDRIIINSYNLNQLGITLGLAPTITYVNTLTAIDNGDPLIITTGTVNNDEIFGALVSDEVHDEGGDDYVEGNTGDDTLYGGDGEDLLLGGLSKHLSWIRAKYRFGGITGPWPSFFGSNSLIDRENPNWHRSLK